MFSKEHLIEIYTPAVHKFSNLIHQADKGEGCNKSQTLVETSGDLSVGFTQTRTHNATATETQQTAGDKSKP